MEQKIRNVSTIAGLGVFLVGCTIFYNVLRWLIPLTMTDPQRWGSWIEDQSKVNVETTDRLFLFGNWMIYFGFVFITVVIAISLCRRYMAGDYFSLSTYKNIRNLGISIIATIIGYYVAMNAQAWILSSTIDGASFPDYAFFYIDPTLLTVVVCGLFFCIIGWVMKIATEIKEDNEAII